MKKLPSSDKEWENFKFPRLPGSLEEPAFPSKNKEKLSEELEKSEKDNVDVKENINCFQNKKSSDFDEEEENDDWNASEEDESWDPDFAEFDLPKSKTKKPAGPKKKGAASEEDDFKLDDDFNDFDLFDDKNGEFDDDDDAF